MLLDEPCAGVNPSLVDQLRELLVELNRTQGGSFVVIEHNMDFIMRLCPHVICMVEGKVMAEGPPAAVQANRAGARGISGKLGRQLSRQLNGQPCRRTEQGRHERDKIIEFDRVVAGYSPSLTILNETTLDARRGEITLLIGPNGAGKSTVLKTLFGMLVPRSGEVRFEGKASTASRRASCWRDGIAFVPQGRNLFGSLSVRHNLELGGITLPRADLGGRIEEVLARFPRIRERIDNQASTLSGGEQKQLEVGRALLLRPRVLLIDEPSIGLSPKLVQEVMALLRAAGRRRHDGADGRAERAHGAQVFQSRAGARDGAPRARSAGGRAAGRSRSQPAVPRRPRRKEERLIRLANRTIACTFLPHDFARRPVTRPISLAALTVIELTPPEIVQCAALAGYGHVGLRLLPVTPREASYDILGDTPLRRELRRYSQRRVSSPRRGDHPT